MAVPHRRALGSYCGTDPGRAWARNYSESDQTVLELLNRFGADGWELAGLQDYREGGDGSSYWEAARLLTVYTFKRRVHSQIGSDQALPLLGPAHRPLDAD
jgi:hypothetical protein